MADPAPAIQGVPQNAPDPEISAIAKVNEALSGLEPAVQHRVLRWAADKFGLTLSKSKESGAAADTVDGSDAEENGDDATFADFASLCEAANPTTDAERALLAGYWLQVVQQNADWDGFSANKELNHIGHRSSNITGALDQLIGQKPQLVIQTHKSGKTRQARKKYKVTSAGIKRVSEMLQSGEESENGGQG